MEILSQQPEYSSDQYLILERKAKHRSEYINGHIFPMAGSSRQHNQITFNISITLGIQMKGRTCVAYANDMRVKVKRTGLYTYPDVVATCNEPCFEDALMDTLLNPAVIIEVLSDSTEAYDRGGKFSHYRRLPSLQEYVLIAQKSICIEHYLRQNDKWILTEVSDITANLSLESIHCNLSLTDIYDKVEISDKESFRLIRKNGEV